MDTIPGYTIVRPLGRGGMAMVYLAVQESLGREVALKILSPSQDDTAGERFLREARIAANLHHPNIVPIHDFGVHEGVAYIAMAYEPSGAISPVAGERLEPGAALRLVRDIAGALDYAHARGVVHRDIKPDNILRRADGAGVLSDFGIARLIQGASQLTVEGTSVGTPHYMSPEQLRGEKVDGRSDIYSLGVVLWQLLTGDLPYSGADNWAIGTQHISADIPRLPPALAHIQGLLDALLAKKADARPGTGADVVRWIDGLLAAGSAPATVPSIPSQPTAQPSPRPVAQPFGASQRRIAWAAVGFALLLVLGWVGWRSLVSSSQGVAPVDEATGSAAKSTVAAQLAPVNSIAVLPFANMSADASDRYFSDGISEELLNVLAKIDGFELASRTSSFAYRGSELGMPAIARQLKVNYLLQGSVRKAGNRVRITAQLIDAGSDRHLWSETYDREMTDIFAIQDEIARAIATALRGSLAAAHPGQTVMVRADTKNPEAYELYLKARELFLAREDMAQSVRLYEHVIELDPNFARGWEGLAAVSAVAGSWGLDDRDYAAVARSAAKQALRLDPSLSAPWSALGMVEQGRSPVDWEKALELLNKAIAADPKDATAYLWRGGGWIRLGYFDRAMADQDRCLELDPGYQYCERMKALTLLYAGETERALALFRKGVAAGLVKGRAPTFIAPLLRSGDRATAALVLDSLGAKPEMREILLEALARPKAPEPSLQARLARALSNEDDPFVKELGPLRRAMWLRDFERVASFQDAAVKEMFVWDRVPEQFRGSPGFKSIVQRSNAPAYWRKHGFPPQCRPVGDDDFSCDEGGR